MSVRKLKSYTTDRKTQIKVSQCVKTEKCSDLER